MATWVIGDIHGQYNTFMNLLGKKEIAPDDRFILIGDIIDRGPEILEMLEWAMENVSEDGKYRMVCGNHEDNVIRGYDRELERYISEYGSEEGFELEDNGILNCKYKFQEYMHSYGYPLIGDIKPFVDWFKTLPIKIDISVTLNDGKTQDYVIVHGWWRKDIDRHDALWERDIKDYIGFLPDYVPEHDEILIHGHTPVFKELGYPYNCQAFIREHSINIDCGCGYMEYGGRLAAIRLEDRKVIYAV